jgi:hypothetical protein
LTDAGATSSKCAIGSAVGIRSKDELAGPHEALFDWWKIAGACTTKIIIKAEGVGEVTTYRVNSGLLGSEGWEPEAVEDDNALGIMETCNAGSLKACSDRRKDLVDDGAIDIGRNVFAGENLILSGSPRQHLLRHCHRHGRSP